MQRRKNNIFFEKFKSLNSQESAEEIIIQSSSDSSDYENVRNSLLTNSSKKVLKRKRRCTPKVSKHVSNLDITACDVQADDKPYFNKEKSPIFTTHRTQHEQKRSPILKPLQTSASSIKFIKREPDFPILSSNIKTSISTPTIDIKSPILALKYSSPKPTKKIKKQLFSNDDCPQNISTSIPNDEYLKEKENRDKNILDNNCTTEEKRKNQFQNISTSLIKEEAVASVHEDDLQHHHINKKFIKKEIISQEISNPTNNVIVKRIQSYFDNNFGSDSASQHSISDILTQKSSSKTSEDFDILTLLSQNLTNRLSNDSIREIKHEVVTRSNSYSSLDFSEKPRKIKYKKDGLAYRLNILLRKQHSTISLWQHERFLAENSNFLIPKSECVIFRVQKVDFKYGCYLIEAMDVESEKYFIVINSSIVLDENIAPEVVLKIYIPYKVEEHLQFKIILNVCKFECVTIKK